MYDELVKELRDPCPHENCVICQKAADAIEELLPFKKQVEKGMGLLNKADELLNAVKPRWIPVTERLPEPMKYVLLMVRRTAKAFNNRPFISTGYVSMNKVSWWCSHDGDCSDNGVEVTHWMPLPEPPKEET